MNKLINYPEILIKTCEYLPTGDILKMLTMGKIRTSFNYSNLLLRRKIALQNAKYPDDFPWAHFIGQINNEMITVLDIPKFAKLLPLEYYNNERYKRTKKKTYLIKYINYWKENELLPNILDNFKHFKYINHGDKVDYFKRSRFKDDAIMNNYLYEEYAEYETDAKNNYATNSTLSLTCRGEIYILYSISRLYMYNCGFIKSNANIDYVSMIISGFIELTGKYKKVEIHNSSATIGEITDKCTIDRYDRNKITIEKCEKLDIESTTENCSFDNLIIGGKRGFHNIVELSICIDKCELQNLPNLKIVYAWDYNDDTPYHDDLYIANCPKLQYVKNDYHNTQIMDCPNLEVIHSCFGCNNPLILKNLPKLKALSIEETEVHMTNCPNIEEIFYDAHGFFNFDNDSGNDIITDVKFKKLKCIWLTDEVLFNHNYYEYIPYGIHPEIKKIQDDTLEKSGYFHNI